MIKQQKKVEKELENLEDDDPVLSDNALAESSEPGTDSWLADTHSRIVAVKQNLSEILTNIKRALSNISNGKYGKCENCGNPIEKERLAAMPTATRCISCSKKPTKKGKL
ncbi:TraR/DksA C4-type zinc finger protein [Candidatus Daviesbacteria bacterium]|nr:TraR/DksA C4-type zinc finger protein [Candidatus Daviesbacteria bacterium]